MRREIERVRLIDGDSISRVVVGCMRSLAGNMTGEEYRKLVHGCIEMGVDTFDHAPVYGLGACERFFGEEILAAEPTLRDQMKIITKCGIFPAGTVGNRHAYYDSRKETILKEMDDSLQRLHTDHVDVLLVHRPDLMSDPGEIAAALEQIVREGKAIHVGVSNYEPALFDVLQHYCREQIELNQVEFSASAVDNYFNGTIECAYRHGTKLMAWSPLGGGEFFRSQDEKTVRLRAEVERVAAERGTTADTILYAWVLRHPVGMIPVTGSMKLERIAHAVEALDLELTYDEWYGIMEASRGYRVP